jgi:hypothetical protein
LISGFCTSNVHWHTTDGMQRTARIHLESLSYSSPTAHSLVSGCRCLEVSLSAVVIPRVLRMRAILSLICLNVRVAECSKNATMKGPRHFRQRNPCVGLAPERIPECIDHTRQVLHQESRGSGPLQAPRHALQSQGDFRCCHAGSVPCASCGPRFSEACEIVGNKVNTSEIFSREL